MGKLPMDYRERICRKLNERDRIMSLIGYLLTRKAVGQKAVIERSEFGRPFVKDSSIDFNVSHDGNYCGICVGDDFCRVGFDICFMDPLIDVQKFQLGFTKLELEMMRDDKRLFFKFWAVKESLIKYWGNGMGSIELNDIEVAFQNHETIVTYKRELINAYFHVQEFEGHVWAVCSDQTPTNDFEILDISHLANGGELV